MQKINNILGAQAEFTPFTGKYSLAGWLFANYDFYVFGGAGVISVTPTNSGIPACQSSNSADNKVSGAAYYCGVSGSKLAATFGAGASQLLQSLDGVERRAARHARQAQPVGP